VVVIAILMASFAEDPVNLQVALQGLPAAARLGLFEARVETLLKEFATEVSALRSALGS
jgi:hypothetical protein